MPDTRTTMQLASDTRGLASLRLQAGKDPKTSVKEAAKQFESLFMQQMLKTMREASSAMNPGLFENQATKLGTEMLDAQMVATSDGKTGGLAELISRQLERQLGLSTAASASPGTSAGAIPGTTAGARSAALAKAAEPAKPAQTGALGFVQQHRETAAEVAGATGIPANFMLAQAALETGWGGKEIVGRDGVPSNNLFGIKAGSSWKGPTVDVLTTEYIGGQMHKVVQTFRAYASHAESFADYARLIGDNPRYAKAKAAVGNAKAFAENLQAAGYATDPKYADKLGRVIDTAQRLARQLA